MWSSISGTPTRLTRRAWVVVGVACLLAASLAGIPARPALAAHGTAITFDGDNDYVTFGASGGLAAQNYTVELWFKWASNSGGYRTSSTASNGGLGVVIPLFTKGRSDGDTTCNKQVAWYLGINMDTAGHTANTLAADFETGSSGGTLGANHPLYSTTVVTAGVWHHAALTVDGANFRIYLDGSQVASLATTELPCATNVEHAGLATGLTSAGSAEGYFNGVIDEARVWNVAHSQAQIQATMHQELTSGTGLIARWGLNEGTGITTADSVGTLTGTLTQGPTWASSGFADLVAPAAPTGLTATSGVGQVALAWTASGKSDLAGYNVYRSTTSPVTAGTPLNGGTLLTSAAYTDTSGTPGTPYHYAVTAVDTSANASSLSDEASGMPGADLASQTITFGPLADRRLDAGPAALSATASSGLPVTFASGTPAVCTVADDEVSLVAVGTCTITADQAGDATYAAAPRVSQDFSVTAVKGDQAITFGPLADRSLTQTPFTLSATASSGLAVSFASGTPLVCTVADDEVSLVAVGTCTITASQAGDADWNAAPDVDRDFAVDLASQTITFGPLADRRLDAGPAALSATASSGLPVTFASGTPAVCTVADDEVSLVAVGTCTITADQAGDATYAAAPRVSQDFSVTAVKGDQAITFGPLADRSLTQTPFTLSATASSGLAVSFASGTPLVCTVADDEVSLVAVGTCTITASQAGDADWNAAPDVDRDFAVDLASQTITFGPLADRRLDAGPAALSATASSGLPVTFASGTPAVCTVADDEVSLVAVGTCTITADQAGDATYAAAPRVSQDFSVTAVAPTVGYLRVTSSPAVPTQVSIDGVIADSWGLNWVKLAPGSYTVHFSHVEGYTEPADQQVTVTAGDTASVTGTFVRRGSLRVVTAPAVAGTVTIDGAARDDWGMWTDLPTGHHEVCFGPVAGYAAPACEDVTLAAGDLATVTGTYTADVTAPGPASVGYLRVTSSPAVPTQVSIDGVIADSWGLNWVKLAPGSYTVHFSHVEGYTEPADQQVTVTAGDTASVTGTFVRRGSLRVVTAPAVAGTVTVDGAARDDWGMWTDLPTGHHEVCFGPVAGYAAPACEDVTLAAGDLATVTGTYAHE